MKIHWTFIKVHWQFMNIHWNFIENSWTFTDISLKIHWAFTENSWAFTDNSVKIHEHWLTIHKSSLNNHLNFIENSLRIHWNWFILQLRWALSSRIRPAMPGYGDTRRPAVPNPLRGELRLCGVLSSHVGDAKRLARLRQCLESVVNQTQKLGNNISWKMVFSQLISIICQSRSV